MNSKYKKIIEVHSEITFIEKKIIFLQYVVGQQEVLTRKGLFYFFFPKLNSTIKPANNSLKTAENPICNLPRAAFLLNGSTSEHFTDVVSILRLR